MITMTRRDSKPIVTTLDSRDAVRANLERFALALGGEETYPFTEEQILGNVAVMMAISRSAKTGRSVKVAELV